jgi:hypothetical protein
MSWCELLWTSPGQTDSVQVKLTRKQGRALRPPRDKVEDGANTIEPTPHPSAGLQQGPVFT